MFYKKLFHYKNGEPIYASVLRTDITGYVLSLLTVSTISICMGVNASAIIPEQTPMLITLPKNNKGLRKLYILYNLA